MKRRIVCFLTSFVLVGTFVLPVNATGVAEAEIQSEQQEATTEIEKEAEETEVKLPEEIKLSEEVVNYGAGKHTVTIAPGASAKDIQAALDLNAEGQYDVLTVVIPAGTYKLDRALYVHSNTTIQADPAALLQKQSGYGALLANKIVDDDGGYDATGNITITGGKWDSKPLMTAKEGTETFRFIHAQNIKVENAVLSNVPEGSHLVVLAGCKDVTITGTKFTGYGDNGDKKKVPKEAVQLDVAHSDELVPTLQPVKWDDLPCDNVTISGCTFEEFSRGIGSHTAVAGVLHKNVNIIGNTFKNLSDSAIRLYNYRDTTVSENKFDNVVSGVLVYTYIDVADSGEESYFKPLNGVVQKLPSNYNIKITKNTIKNIKLLNGVWGDGIRVLGIKSRPLYSVTILENTIQNAARYGIFATYAPNIVIDGKNNITNTKKHGILIETNSNNAKILNNTVSTTGEAGIAVYTSTGATVDKNIISTPKGVEYAGIYAYQAPKCVIGTSSTSFNKVNGSKGYGIYLTGNCTSSKIQYNTVSSAAKDGIGVYSSSSVLVKGNTMTASKDGIDINTKSTKAIVENNTITSAGENGIWISSGSKASVIKGNTIKKYAVKSKTANYAGIYVYQSGGTSAKANTQILSNTIVGSGTGTKKDGIRISESAYTAATQNKISATGGSGIYLYKSANCTIGSSSKSYNTITSPKVHGIYLTTSCHNGKVLYNKVSGTTKDGIGVYSSKKVNVKGNKVTAGENGIYVNTNSSGVKITSNTITKAGRYGIWLSSGSKASAIEKNQVLSYGSKGNYNGIYVYKAGGTSAKANTKILSNTVKGSGKSTKKDGIKVSESAYTTISKNTVTAAPGSGIYVYKSKSNTVSDNKISKARGRGIYLTTACDKAKVTGNTISGTTDTGIATYKAAGTAISKNKVTMKKGLRGIWVSTSGKSSITYNTIKGAKKADAVVVTSSAGTKQSKNKITK